MFAEVMRLGGCVASYAGRCVAGYSAIVSMRRDGVRQITVEVIPHSRSVLQARGLQNRAATRQEQAIVDAWVRTVLDDGDPDAE